MTRRGARDHYAVLGLAADAPSTSLRKAFRKRLLELHPDKAACEADPAQLQELLEAFEVLGDPVARRHYDQACRERRAAPGSNASTPRRPHITESERPADRARAILYLLLRERWAEARDRLGQLGPDPLPFLEEHLDDEELVDLSFLLGENHERLRQSAQAVRWYEEVVLRERQRRRHRPCYPEALARLKKLLRRHAQRCPEPRLVLGTLQRLELLELSPLERSALLRRRAHCLLALGMQEAAAAALREALSLQPRLRGAQKLREVLAPHFPDAGC